jgi:hypothetical protein
MSVLLLMLGFFGGLVLLVVRSLAVDEVKGRLQHRVRVSVEATIDALPPDLQAEWGEEWRAELDAVITMPFAAAQFAHGLRRSARELVADPAYTPAAIEDHPLGPLSGPARPPLRHRWRFRLFIPHVPSIALRYLLEGLVTLIATIIASLLFSPILFASIIYLAIPAGALVLIVAGGMLVAGNANGMTLIARTAVSLGALLLAKAITSGLIM